MTYQAEQLTKRIMRRVYALYLFRQLTQGVSLRATLLLLSLGGLLSSVSIGNVVRNMPNLSDVSGIVSFYASALAETNIAVQFLTFLLIVSAMFLVRDIVASIRNRMLIRSTV